MFSLQFHYSRWSFRSRSCLVCTIVSQWTISWRKKWGERGGLVCHREIDIAAHITRINWRRIENLVRKLGRNWICARNRRNRRRQGVATKLFSIFILSLIIFMPWTFFFALKLIVLIVFLALLYKNKINTLLTLSFYRDVVKNKFPSFFTLPPS